MFEAARHDERQLNATQHYHTLAPTKSSSVSKSSSFDESVQLSPPVFITCLKTCELENNNFGIRREQQKLRILGEESWWLKLW